ncbi:MAG: SDR family oxidoreductase [Pseudomonadota bacterium]|nr:SDR family oxidoreductase [Pseudomonadota bacterium]
MTAALFNTEKVVGMIKKPARDKWVDESCYNEFLTPFAFERAGKVEEIANTAVLLVSNLSSYTSGTIVTADGGMVHKGPLF